MSEAVLETRTELIAAPILEANKLVEDAAPGFALAWPADAAVQRKRIDNLSDLASSLTALAAAAMALHRRETRNPS